MKIKKKKKKISQWGLEFIILLGIELGIINGKSEPSGN
jgi:hypothetical protein